MKYLVTLLITFLLSFPTIAQHQRQGLTWQPYVKVAKMFSHEYGIGSNHGENEDLNGYAILGTHVVAEYFFVPQFGLGLGLGVDRYFGQTFTTLPLTFDLKWFASDKTNAPFISLAYSQQLPLAKGLEKGQGIFAGIGYAMAVGSKMSFWFKSELGTSRIKIDTVENYDFHDFSHLNLQFGLLF